MDLISRHAAIRRYCGEHCGCEPQDCGLTMGRNGSEECDFVRFLKEEPSAQPKQKTGRWNFIGYNMYQCTNCDVTYTEKQLNGLKNYKYDLFLPKYCPNCGSCNGESISESGR